MEMGLKDLRGEDISERPHFELKTCHRFPVTAQGMSDRCGRTGHNLWRGAKLAQKIVPILHIK